MVSSAIQLFSRNRSMDSSQALPTLFASLLTCWLRLLNARVFINTLLNAHRIVLFRQNQEKRAFYWYMFGRLMYFNT